MNLFAATVLTLSCVLTQEPAQNPKPSEAQPPRGLVKTTEHASPGFTLIAPLQSFSTYLVDLSGKTVHEWKSDATPGNSVELLENGDLLRTERLDNSVFRGGGQGGRVREIDWDGKVVWEYVCSDEKQMQHHAVERLPNGHVLVIAWERKTGAEALAAGRDPKSVSGGEFWPDMLLEIEPTLPVGGKVVWEWHAWDHLIQDLDAKQSNFGDVAKNPGRIDINADHKPAVMTDKEREELAKLRKLGYASGGDDDKGQAGPPNGMRGGDWMHTNAVDYNPALDVILLSTCNLSELWIIDHSTTTAQAKSNSGGRYGKGGDLLFRYGNPANHRAGSASDQRTFGQHDVQWIGAGLAGAGHVLVFNNGTSEKHAGSSVDELALPASESALREGSAAKAELAWTYTAPEISSGHISGAQRLANGDTLICVGETGRVVEVTQKGEVVWDYLNPLGGDAPIAGPDGFRGGPPGGGPPGGGRDGQGPPPGGGRRGPPPGGGRRPGGPDGMGRMDMQHGLFRAPRYAPDFAGLAKLGATAEAKAPATPAK
jgi:hypothetical protein